MKFILFIYLLCFHLPLATTQYMEIIEYDNDKTSSAWFPSTAEGVILNSSTPFLAINAKSLKKIKSIKAYYWKDMPISGQYWKNSEEDAKLSKKENLLYSQKWEFLPNGILKNYELNISYEENERFCKGCINFPKKIFQDTLIAYTSDFRKLYYACPADISLNYCVVVHPVRQHWFDKGKIVENDSLLRPQKIFWVIPKTPKKAQILDYVLIKDSVYALLQEISMNSGYEGNQTTTAYWLGEARWDTATLYQKNYAEKLYLRRELDEFLTYAYTKKVANFSNIMADEKKMLAAFLIVHKVLPAASASSLISNYPKLYDFLFEKALGFDRRLPVEIHYSYKEDTAIEKTYVHYDSCGLKVFKSQKDFSLPPELQRIRYFNLKDGRLLRDERYIGWEIQPQLSNKPIADTIIYDYNEQGALIQQCASQKQGIFKRVNLQPSYNEVNLDEIKNSSEAIHQFYINRYRAFESFSEVIYENERLPLDTLCTFCQQYEYLRFDSLGNWIERRAPCLFFSYQRRNITYFD